MFIVMLMQLPLPIPLAFSFTHSLTRLESINILCMNINCSINGERRKLLHGTLFGHKAFPLHFINFSFPKQTTTTTAASFQMSSLKKVLEFPPSS